MTRTLIADLRQHIEETVTIYATLDVVRNQGKVAFYDFRDRTSVVQGVIFGKPELLASVQTVKQGYSLEVTGIVHARPEKMVNEKICLLYTSCMFYPTKE